MTDPAVEAARKVWERHEHPYRSDDLIAAARAALKPIQDWFDRNYGMSSITDHLLDELAPLIFTTEEINQ
ncbi:hypothetical protein [Mycobacteroides abscessus]|uniref:hypothetical protein n=1 Tax=Mycobacteroides abscessus TaxID=36809 RepID=UPI0009A8DDED|nr:hypothetical protein [Mycobacteroides abscessus]RIU09636.1 hypothetical protein D2E94_11030 [Mycobacteroides abscessus]SLF57756.1 Uncharacterised protein [Mycobacteroides abscessus subsp. abscessus]